MVASAVRFQKRWKPLEARKPAKRPALPAGEEGGDGSKQQRRLAPVSPDRLESAARGRYISHLHLSEQVLLENAMDFERRLRHGWDGGFCPLPSQDGSRAGPGFPRRRSGLLFAAVLSLAAASCSGGASEEDLLDLPSQACRLLREGNWGDALEFLADDFETHGMTRAQLAAWLPAVRDTREQPPYIACLEILESSGDERTLLVAGLFGRNPMQEARLSRMKPFRAVVGARIVDGRWRIHRISYEE